MLLGPDIPIYYIIYPFPSFEKPDYSFKKIKQLSDPVLGKVSIDIHSWFC